MHPIISNVASGLLLTPPPPSVIPMGHAGTLVATDGVNVMSMSNSTSGNITVGPVSDLSQIDNTWTKPFTAASSIQGLQYGAGVWMVVDWDSKSYWSDDLGENWTVGTGHDPAFNTAQVMYYGEELGAFMINNHQNTYSLDGKNKSFFSVFGVQAGTITQLEFKGTTYTYYQFSQRFGYYNTGTDYTLGWNAFNQQVVGTPDSRGMASNGIVIAQVMSNSFETKVRTSSDGVVFGANIVTSGLTATNSRHIMWHEDEWVIINLLGACWTSDDLITWVAQGDTYLTGTASGHSNSDWHGMENQNIIRWGSGAGSQKENFAIFFVNQIYQSIGGNLPPVIPPTAYELLRDDIVPTVWYRLNETSGSVITDEVIAEVGSYSGTIVQNAVIIDYTEDTGSLAMESAESISVPNSIPNSWNADSDTLETLWISMWVQVDSLASQIDLLDSGDPTRFNIKINTNGSVTLRYADIAVATGSPGLVVAGVRSNICYWVEYTDQGGTFCIANIRSNVGGVAESGSIAAAFSPTRFPNLNLGGFTIGKFDGEIDELIIRYGNLAGADVITQAKGIEWNAAIFDLQP